jgi:hypothetical protein
MSFRTAYSDFRRGKRRTSRSQGYFRDPTPEEWQKTMDEYFKREQNKKNGRYK